MTTEFRGADADPTRSLRLLWGVQGRPSRGPKPALTVERIIRAAIDLADAEGLAAVSMRRVGDQLGVGTMSLYRYVPGKAELLALMLDAVTGEVALPERSDSGWRADLERGARNHWALYHRHPWTLQVPWSRPVPGPNMMADYEWALRTVADTGLPEQDVIGLVHTLLDYVRGAARVSVEVMQASRNGSDERFWSETGAFLEGILQGGQYPAMSKVMAVVQEPPYGDKFFEFGLQRVLDGIEAFVLSATGQEKPVNQV